MAGFPKGEKRIAEKAKRPKPGVPFDPKIVESLLIKHEGNVARTADSLGASRGALRNFIDRSPHLQEVVAQCRERLIDELEESVWTRARKSNDTGLQAFLLKTIGKSRGYDQNEAQHTAKDIATAAFDFILNKQSKRK